MALAMTASQGAQPAVVDLAGEGRVAVVVHDSTGRAGDLDRAIAALAQARGVDAVAVTAPPPPLSLAAGPPVVLTPAALGPERPALDRAARAAGADVVLDVWLTPGHSEATTLVEDERVWAPASGVGVLLAPGVLPHEAPGFDDRRPGAEDAALLPLTVAPEEVLTGRVRAEARLQGSLQLRRVGEARPFYVRNLDTIAVDERLPSPTPDADRTSLVWARNLGAVARQAAGGPRDLLIRSRPDWPIAR